MIKEGIDVTTVVITGSTRGFGLEQAKEFKKAGFNVVLSGTSEKNLNAALEKVQAVCPGKSEVIGTICNVTDCEAVQKLWDTAKEKFGKVDIWINNAGVNQPDKPVYELTDKEIEFMLDTDLKGTIYGSKTAFAGMKEQGEGQIFNVEGYGSNDAMMTGLTLYGTTKRAVTYFTQALAKESGDITNGAVKVGRLAPGIMLTDFLNTANGGNTHFELPEKTKKVYSILGDYPETIARYVVPRMIANNKNNARIIWLTNRRAFVKFLTAGRNKKEL